MKKKLTYCIIIIAVLVISLSIWWFSDAGRDYEDASFHPNSSFIAAGRDEITFKPSTNHVFEYIVGRKPSRISSAHGHTDRILIEFKGTPDPDSGLCEIIQVYRTGYRRGSDYGVKSLDDAWINVSKSKDHYWLEGAIKLTAKLKEGFNADNWDIVYIERRELKL